MTGGRRRCSTGGGRWRVPSVRSLSEGMARCAEALLVLLALLTLTDVLLRKVLARGILGTLELSEFLLAAMVFLSLAQGELRDRNIRFDLALERLPASLRNPLERLLRLLLAVFFTLLAGSLALLGLSLQRSGELSPDLLIPKGPFVYLAALGCAVLALALLSRLRCGGERGKGR